MNEEQLDLFAEDWLPRPLTFWQWAGLWMVGDE